MRTLCASFALLAAISGCGVIKTNLSSSGGAAEKPAATPPTPAGAAAEAPADSGPSDPALPATVLALIHERYPSAEQDAGARRVNYELFGGSNEAFEAAWTAYQARKSEVAQVVAQAEKLAAKDQKAASALLQGSITPVRIAGKRGQPVIRQFVEPADAELDALILLAKLTEETRDQRLYAGLVREFFGRRRVGDNKEEERLLWFAYRNERSFRNLGHAVTPEGQKRIDEIATRAAAILEESAQAASGLWASKERYGLTFVRVGTKKKGLSAGAWVAVNPPSLKLGGTTASYVVKQAFQVPYDCVPTGRIDSIDPVTGKVHYVEKCKYRNEKIDESLTASLTEASPELEREIGRLWVVGRVKKAGPHMELEAAFVPDLRFFLYAPNSPWAPSEREIVTSEGKVELQKN